MAKSKGTAQAQQWLRSGQAPVERVGDVARALALLSGEVPLTPAVIATPLAEDIEHALLCEATDRDAIDLLLLLRDHGHAKGCAKQAKKALFRARQRGIQVPDELAPKAAVSLARKPEPLPCYCSSFDSTGGQIIVLGGWSPEDGPNAMVAFLSDRSGLETATWFPGMSRTRQRQVIDDLSSRFTGITVGVGPEFAAGRIRWALDVADRLGRPVEGDVAVLRRLIDAVPPIADIELNLDPADEARVEERIAASATLAEEACFRRWLPVGDRPMARLYDEIERSPWISDPEVTGQDLRERLEALRADGLLAGIDAAERQRMAIRLELTGWLLARHGKRELALIAISTARAVRDPERELAMLPFVVRDLANWVATDALESHVDGLRARPQVDG